MSIYQLLFGSAESQNQNSSSVCRHDFEVVESKSPYMIELGNRLSRSVNALMTGSPPPPPPPPQNCGNSHKQLETKVCLKCRLIIDEIGEYRKTFSESENAKRTRKEIAKEIMQDSQKAQSMPKLKNFESGAVCAAQIPFQRGDLTVAFDILDACVDRSTTRPITDFDEADQQMIVEYREERQTPNSAGFQAETHKRRG